MAAFIENQQPGALVRPGDASRSAAWDAVLDTREGRRRRIRRSVTDHRSRSPSSGVSDVSDLMYGLDPSDFDRDWDDAEFLESRCELDEVSEGGESGSTASEAVRGGYAAQRPEELPSGHYRGGKDVRK